MVDLKSCVDCGGKYPAARPYPYCVMCAPAHARNRVFVEACYGFKGNGTCVVPLEDQAAHAENVCTRG